jgi:hypothetical protein
MKNWQVTYNNNGKTITKFYANMGTATQAVAKLASKGIKADYCPVYQGGNSI